jgi:hypothetical protein
MSGPIFEQSNALGKRLLLGMLLLFFVLPPLQAAFHWLPESKLGGAFNLAPDPELSWDELTSNSFQPALEKYLEDRIGFRNLLVRLHNQVLFSGLGITRSSEIVLGKNNVLFMPNYIGAYVGQDRMDPEAIRWSVLRLRMMQHDLAQHGISFLFVLAPSKARFEPENLPPHPAPAAETNYSLFVKQMQADSVHLLDCVALYARWKPTAPYPLYPRGGTHWSGYGATLVADSLMHRLEHIGGYRLPSFREVGKPEIVYSSDSLRSTDNDLNSALNLLFRRETSPLAYRNIQFEAPRPGQIQPSLLLVSDSYCWGLMGFSPYLQREFAPDSRIWFYNITEYNPTVGEVPIGPVSKLNFKEQLESRRTVVMMMTEFNLPGREFWFTEQVYQLYHPLTEADKLATNQLAASIQTAANAEGKTMSLEEAHYKAQERYEGQQMEKLLASRQ